jgi:hypothetical protein
VHDVNSNLLSIGVFTNKGFGIFFTLKMFSWWTQNLIW